MEKKFKLKKDYLLKLVIMTPAMLICIWETITDSHSIQNMYVFCYYSGFCVLVFQYLLLQDLLATCNQLIVQNACDICSFPQDY